MSNTQNAIQNIRALLLYHQMWCIFRYTEARRILEETRDWQTVFPDDNDDILPKTLTLGLLVRFVEGVRNACRTVQGNLVVVTSQPQQELLCKAIEEKADSVHELGVENFKMKLVSENTEYAHEFVERLQNFVKEAEAAVSQAETKVNECSTEMTKLNDKRTYPLAGKFAAFAAGTLKQHQKNFDESVKALATLQWLMRELKLDAPTDQSVQALCAD